MTKSIIKFVRFRDVNLPARGHKSDAGIDFFVPKFQKSFLDALIEKNSFLVTKHPIYINSGQLCISNNISISISDENNTFIKFDQAVGKPYFLLLPLDRVNIPSGIYCKMSEKDRALIAANKSGIASKNGLIFGAQVVDSEYQGEIHINVINTSDKPVRIYEDQKLIQFIETPIILSDIKEVDTLANLYGDISDRGVFGFGSTDAKPINS